MVNLRRRLAVQADDPPRTQLPRLPLSPRDHQSRRLALSSFCLSFRDVEDLLAQRGVTVTWETIRQ